VEPEVALSLSDAFIQKCELLSDLEQIINLQYGMVLEYTERVARLHRSACGSQLAAQVVNYIHHHLSEAITVEAIAQHLYLSRPYLSAKFKQETGMTLTDFILREKTAEAKYLLRHTDKSLSAIGDYLGFSSQSHFSKVFRRYAGCSPSAYRGREE
jgi:AraC-like DNA-binding protein